MESQSSSVQVEQEQKPTPKGEWRYLEDLWLQVSYRVDHGHMKNCQIQ